MILHEITQYKEITTDPQCPNAIRLTESDRVHHIYLGPVIGSFVQTTTITHQAMCPPEVHIELTESHPKVCPGTENTWTTALHFATIISPK